MRITRYGIINIPGRKIGVMSLYFIALLAPPAIDWQVLQFKQYMHKNHGAKAALKTPAHITLIPPFKMDTDKQQMLSDALCRFSRLYRQFQVCLENFDAFEPRVIFVKVVNNQPLEQIAHELEKDLILHCFPVYQEKRPFHPHMSIANRDLGKDEFEKAWPVFRHKQYLASFAASAITLLNHNCGSWQIVTNAPLPVVS